MTDPNGTSAPSSGTAATSDANHRLPVAPGDNREDFSLTAAEAECLGAILDALIPADEVWPGARGAGVLQFIERQLAGPYGAACRWYMHVLERDKGRVPLKPRDLYRIGLAQTDLVATAEQASGFSELGADQAVHLLRRMECGALDTETAPMRAFFELVLENAMEGYFSDPVHGGNHGAVSWKMVGFPGCGHDYSTMIVTHRNRNVDLPVRSILSLQKGEQAG